MDARTLGQSLGMAARMMPAGAGRNVANFAAFQAGWFALVLSAASGRPFFGIALAAVLATVHLALVESPSRELKRIAGVAAAGFAIDSMLASAGVLEFDGMTAGFHGLLLCPLWLVSLWALFATTLGHSLSWLRGRPALAASLGAVGGPASYYAGSQFGALGLGSPEAMSLAILAIVWGALMPLITR